MVALIDGGLSEVALTIVTFGVIYGAGFGLGGWGSLTLACLKRLFGEEEVRDFRFLCIDTDELKQENIHADRVGLTEEDLAIIAPEHMRVAFRAGEDFDIQDDPHIAEIVPESVQPLLLDPAVTLDGGQAIRSLGAIMAQRSR